MTVMMEEGNSMTWSADYHQVAEVARHSPTRQFIVPMERENRDTEKKIP